jgi:3',5'-cyclic AMP phosphodiesterase CpdA
VLGWLSWRRRRRHEHRPEILEALLGDLKAQAPDHVAVTGDLTNVGLPGEITDAVPWLERLGGPSQVSLVPGNHDAYAAPIAPDRFVGWAPYWRGEGPGSGEEDPGGEAFPYVRRAGAVALVGLCSAVPTAPGLASGRLGEAQLARLEPLLERLAGEPCCRVVLVHHPPVPAGQSPRRRLSDAPALREILARAGAELVLHGHTHRASFETLPGPGGPIPVVGVSSSSARGREPARRASYHLYGIEPAGAGFRLSCRSRVLEPESGRFEEGPERAL